MSPESAGLAVREVTQETEVNLGRSAFKRLRSRDIGESEIVDITMGEQVRDALFGIACDTRVDKALFPNRFSYWWTTSQRRPSSLEGGADEEEKEDEEDIFARPIQNTTRV